MPARPLLPASRSLPPSLPRWILAADPDAGLQMFAGMEPPLPPSDVLPILTAYAPQLAGGCYMGTAGAEDAGAGFVLRGAAGTVTVLALSTAMQQTGKGRGEGGVVHARAVQSLCLNRCPRLSFLVSAASAPLLTCCLACNPSRLQERT